MDSYGRRSRSPRIKEENGYGRDNRGGRDGGDTYRRRSPVDRRRTGRDRSRSPIQNDRYQPGRRDDPPFRQRDDRGYGRRNSPPMGPPVIDRYVPGDIPMPAFNPVIDPLKMDVSVGFNYFAEWWRAEQKVIEERERLKSGGRRPPERLRGDRESREERDKERDLIQAAYDEYKEKMQVQNSKLFCQQHKHEEWFKEKYDPDLRDPSRKRQAEFRREGYTQWEQDLDSGVFDEFTLEGIYKNDSNGAGGVVEKEEGETIAAAEVLGVGDLLPSKGGDLVDEATMQPALLIKTIAPHVSRAQLEVFCREHIGEGEGGFKWLSLSDPNTMKKCHRIGWVMLNPGGDEMVNVTKEVEMDDGREDDGENDEDRMNTTTETQVRSGAEKALAEINGKALSDEERGDFTVHVGIHVPSAQPRKKALWDLFSAPERVERDLDLALRLVAKFDQEMGEDINGVSKIEERVEDLRSRGLLQPVNGVKPQRALGEEPDDEDNGEIEEDGAADEEHDDEELLVKKKKLDLLVEYLRRVFNFCFFCVFESDSVHELTRKCPGGHLRRPRASLTSPAKEAARASARGKPFVMKRSDTEDNEGGASPNEERKFIRNNKVHQQLLRAYNWVKTYEDKVLQLLEPDSVDLKKLGGCPPEEALEEQLKKFVKKEDESKYRCKIPGCTKLFKGDTFWKKHVEKRHEEWYAEIKKDLDIVNNYVLDPGHIVPARDGPQNGGFGNNMQSGTPRGYQFQGIPPPYGYPGMPPPPPPGYFGGYPVTMPGPMPPYGYPPDPVGGRGGPMRRGAGRYNDRPAGPYDRPPRDARNMRWAGPDQGRPPMRFADAVGAGPGAAVSTREAVQGRSLKSYEDLDAVGDDGPGKTDGGGLDY